MSDQPVHDELFVAVRAARPAPPQDRDSPFSVQAQDVLNRALTDASRRPDRRARRSRRWSGAALPVLASATAVAIAAVALLTLGHRPGRDGAAGTGTAHSLTAAQYVYAVGGDSPFVSGGTLLFRADQVLRTRCMQRRGFHYVQDPTPTGGGSSLPSVTEHPSTFYPQPSVGAYREATLLALREREGFGIHQGAVGPRGPGDPDDRYVKTLSPARRALWLKAWHGRGGCYGVAETQLYGSRRAANMELLVPDLVSNYLNTVAYTARGTISRSDPRTAAAAAAWSRCMENATGHRWSDENDLITWLSGQYSPSRQRTARFARIEAGFAVADTRCAYSTGQAQTFAAAFRRAADHLPAGIGGQLRFVLAHRRLWIMRARKILASSRPETPGAPRLARSG